MAQREQNNVIEIVNERPKYKTISYQILKLHQM